MIVPLDKKEFDKDQERALRHSIGGEDYVLSFVKEE